MNRYADNAKRLALFAPFCSMTISAAYLVPFFLQRGWSLGQILQLQAIFSAISVAWEIPSGLIADRIGRARSIKLSVPFAAASLVAYGFSNCYWQFLTCEALLALASGLLGGADMALLYDSLAADDSLDELTLRARFAAASRRIKSAAFGAVLPATPIAMLIAHIWGVGATLVADGLLLLVGWLIISRLVEPPRHRPDTATDDKQASLRLRLRGIIRVIAALFRKYEARWLLVLGTLLGLSTYLGAWASAQYYSRVGIPLVAFAAAVFAVRSSMRSLLAYRYGDSPNARPGRCTAWLRRKWFAKPAESRTMWAYVGLSGLPYVTMASGQALLLPAIAGHDIVYALHDDHLNHRLNESMDPQYRAMLNSVVRMSQRLALALGGIGFGWLNDHVGLSSALLLAGLLCPMLSASALWKLQRHGSFAG